QLGDLFGGRVATGLDHLLGVDIEVLLQAMAGFGVGPAGGGGCTAKVGQVGRGYTATGEHADEQWRSTQAGM
ncbi:hypothetical protein ACQZEU_12585, partial [Corynebacterium diphtheriae]